MHAVIARDIVAEQLGDLHAQAAVERLAREARRPRRARLALRLPRGGRAQRRSAARGPARGTATI